jgi:hypothetical protein
MVNCLYEELWRRLNQADVRPLEEHSACDTSSLEFSNVLQHFKETTNSTSVDLRALSSADEANLAAKGISPSNLLRNLKKTLNPRYPDPRAFQLAALKTRTVHAICPFTGKRVESNHSLLANINTIFYRFRTERVFYVIVGGVGYGFKKSALYFPDFELIVTTGDSWTFDQEDLIELKARMVCSFSQCYSYLSEPTRETAVSLGFYHFAHHLWNELSGLHRIKQKRLFNNVDKFLIVREPLGKIEQIFPEIPAGRLKRHSNTRDLFKDILTSRYFVVRVGGDFIPRDLADRVYNVARRNCVPEVLKQTKIAKLTYSPLLWIGIRLGDRVWADQVDGIAQLISSLRDDFPKLGVVFDGFSLPADRVMQPKNREYDLLIEQENAIVSSIVERLERHPDGAPGIFNIIGSSIFDANLWAHAIDFYISPYGTLQHKVGWLARKPGVIHTNQTLLQQPPEYIWAAVEKAVPPRFVRGECVSDIRSAERSSFRYNAISDADESGAGVLAVNDRVCANPEFNNYRVDWKALYYDVLSLIRSPKNSFTPLPILLRRSKMKLKKTIQEFRAVFDASNI